MPAAKKAAQLPKVTFGSVAVVVSDRARSLAWYTKNFGLDVMMKLDAQAGHWVTVGRKGQNGVVHLCQMTEFDPSFPLEPGNTGIQFHLPGDFRDSCAALEANGVHFTRPPKKEPWGWWAQVADPDGNLIMLTPA
ncbi:MAG: VOC family protein [Thermoplasmata archaeon]